MIISHFNRYFEKHGRKTYIVLGIIISLMFVVFVTPGDIFSGGNAGSNDFGRMYGKKLKRQFINQKMSETYVGICARYPQALGQDLGNEMLFHETLNRMRILHEAKKRNLDEVSNQEVAEAIHKNSIFQDNGKFSHEFFRRFTENFLQPRGLVPVDFDRIVKENIIIERLEEEITQSAKVDESEVTGYVEKYTAKVADFSMDITKDFQPAEEEINAFFSKRKNELKMPDSKAALIASFVTADVLAKATAPQADAELQKRLEPSEDEIKSQYEALKERVYKDKTLDSVKNEIARNLRMRNARRVLEETANALKDKFDEEVKGEVFSERLARFQQEAEKAGAKVVQSGFVTGSDQIPGLPGRQANLVNAIRKLEEKGQISSLAYSATGMALACLTEVQPAALPAEITPEVRTLIVDALLTEKALAFFQEKVAPFSGNVASVNDRRELARPKFDEIQKDLTLSDEEKQAKVKEWQDEISEYVYPFFRDAKRSFALVSFKPEQLLEGISEQDIDLQAGYAKRADEYQKKQVRLSKIVMKTEGLEDAAKKAKRAKMEEALAKLQGGAAFNELAGQYSDEKEIEETALQDVKKLAPELAEQVTALQAGQLSGIIETPASLLLVKVLERQDGRSLDEVRAELTAILRKEKSVQLAYEAALDFAGRLSDRWWKDTENGVSFEGVRILAELASDAKSASFELIEKIPRNGMVNPEIGQEPELLKAVFETSTKEPLTGAVKGDKASYVAYLQEIEVPSLADPLKDHSALNTLKNIYRRKVALETTRVRAKEEAERINAALEKGIEFAEAAGKTVFTDLPAFSRMEPGDLNQKARISDVGTTLLAVSKAQPGQILEPQKTFSGYALIYLVSKTLPDDEDSKKMLENVRGYILRREQQKALSDFYQLLEKESDTQLPEGLQTRHTH
ncbi:MAG: peptidyl-prolyl cis-trans isomerase [Lentisphaeria bacterium]|nr:peptidyl-prolyl cis-trans isomerase [Lentisphaeria bacterium]